MREVEFDSAAPDGGRRRVPNERVARSSGVGVMLALQRAIGNRQTARLVRSSPRVRWLHRYKILGPFNMGQPVHETLTVLAVGRAIEKLKAMGKDPGPLLKDFDTSKLPKLDEGWGFDPRNKQFNFDPAHADKSFQQFIRGVVWADDPKGLLFDKDEDATNYSSGASWYSEFSAGEKGKFSASKDDLIARSHFGDLQFFHGMASADDELPSVTKDKMLTWGRFLVDVASGRVAPDTKIKDVATIKDLFPANADWSVKKLFVYEKASDLQARQRAVGVLFHLIQDSFAHGHVQRDPETEDIEEFHAYGGQDEEKHGAYDYFAKGKNLREQLKRTVGASSALNRCAEVLVKIANGDSTDEIVDYLDTVVFKLAPNLYYSGPGSGLGKKGTVPTDKPVPKLPQPAGDFPVPTEPTRVV